jgi:hypothetical protein
LGVAHPEWGEMYRTAWERLLDGAFAFLHWGCSSELRRFPGVVPGAILACIQFKVSAALGHSE